MNDQELIDLLRFKQPSRARTRRCPDENQLAGYIHEQLSEAQKRELDSHFADCDACLETLALLVTADEKPMEAVPAALLVRARSLAETKSRFVWRWRWAFATASACAVVLVLFGVARYSSPNDAHPTDLVAVKTEPSHTPIVVPSPTIQESGSAVRTPKFPDIRNPAVRGIADAQKPVLAWPRNGGILSTQQSPIRWKPVVDATFYEVTIVKTDGGHVLTRSTTDTQLDLQDQLLQAGEKYFITVTAHLSGNRTVRSDLVSFHVTSKP